MALNAFLKLKGEKQGEIKGGVTQKGREGSILVNAANHELAVPRDITSGLPTGRVMHKPFVITKLLDKSSPLLYQALINNENITEWLLQFWATAVNGIEKQEYAVKLGNARITDIRFVMPNNKVPELAKLNEYEEVEFVYQSIEWTWTDGGITASGKWE